MATITTVTLTYNEEKNIEECISSFRDIVDRVVVLDGYSTDETVEIAKRMGAEVFQKDCGYYDRFQYGMETVCFDTDWILFIDADERLTIESRRELVELCEVYKHSEVNGIVVNYRVNFMGKELRHGASVLRKLRVFKPGTAFMENLALDQHIRLNKGEMIKMKSYLLHKDFKGVENWSQKHIRYAGRAAEDYLNKMMRQEKVEFQGLESGAKMKRIFKYNIYYKLPAGMRAWIFYVYRYYFCLGFLDGFEGKVYTYLHAYWYRFLVDAIIYEKMREKE